MGAFFKSFWGQLGRSTGRRVSNAVFGDKWSTPYRVAVDKNKGKHREQPQEVISKRRYRQPDLNRDDNNATSRPKNYRWVYWVAGIILFSGTYNAILYPSKGDVVLIIMLWVVVIAAYVLHKKNSTDK